MSGKRTFLSVVRVLVPLVIIASLLLGCSAGDPDEPTGEVAAIAEPEQDDEQVEPEVEEQEAPEDQAPEEEVAPVEFILVSDHFEEGGVIPVQFSCDGENISPALEWSGAPENTASYVLIMDDPDAPVGTWIHWVLFNIPCETTRLAKAIPAEPVLGDGSIHAGNSWERSDYGGPCPPGGTHRYFFKLFALGSMLDLPAGSLLEDVLQSMQDHILAETSLMGTFTR